MTEVRSTISGDGAGRMSRDPAHERLARERFGGTEDGQRGIRQDGRTEGRPGAPPEGRGDDADLADRAGAFARQLARQDQGDQRDKREETPDRELAAALALAARMAAPPEAASPAAPVQTPRGAAEADAIAERIAQATREALFLSHGEPIGLRLELGAGALASAHVTLTARTIEVVLATGAGIEPGALAGAARDLRERLAQRFPNRRITVDEPAAGLPPAPSGSLSELGALIAGEEPKR